MSPKQLLFVFLAICFIDLCSSVAVAGQPVFLFDGSSLENFDVIGCEVRIVDGAIKLESGNGLVKERFHSVVVVKGCLD